MSYTSLLFTMALLFSLLVVSAGANPLGGVVQNGSISINKASGKVDVNWKGFDANAAAAAAKNIDIKNVDIKNLDIKNVDIKQISNSLPAGVSVKNMDSMMNQAVGNIPVDGKVAFVVPTEINEAKIRDKMNELGLESKMGDLSTVSFGDSPLVNYEIPTDKLAAIKANGGSMDLTPEDTAKIAGAAMNLDGVDDSNF